MNMYKQYEYKREGVCIPSICPVGKDAKSYIYKIMKTLGCIGKKLQ